MRVNFHSMSKSLFGCIGLDRPPSLNLRQTSRATALMSDSPSRDRKSDFCTGREDNWFSVAGVADPGPTSASRLQRNCFLESTLFLLNEGSHAGRKLDRA